jgi:hypothetical protein
MKTDPRRVRGKERWCLWHPKDGLVPRSMSCKPETRKQFEYRHACYLERGSSLRIVRVALEPTMTARLLEPLHWNQSRRRERGKT